MSEVDDLFITTRTGERFKKVKGFDPLPSRGMPTQQQKEALREIIKQNPNLIDFTREKFQDVISGKTKTLNGNIANNANLFIFKGKEKEDDEISVTTELINKLIKGDEMKEKPIEEVKEVVQRDKLNKIIQMLSPEEAGKFMDKLVKLKAGELDKEEKTEFLKLYKRYGSRVKTAEYKRRLERHQLEGAYLQRLRNQLVQKK